MNTGDIRIKRWVLHDVPNSPKKGNGQPLGLSDDISPHSDKVASYLDRRLSSSLGKAAREVQEQASESELAVPKAVRKFFDSSHDALLEVSRDLAGYLHTCQSGNVSSGLLVVAQAEDAVAGEKMLVIMKLEPQDGVRATKTTRDDGSVVYDIGYVDDLMLTQQTRVFKVAVFGAKAAAKKPIKGYAVDEQIQRTSGLAHFFLTTFLGCELQEKDEVITQRFLNEGEKFATALPPQERPQFVAAMQTELGSNEASISIDAFAAKHLKTDRRKDFKDHMKSAAVPKTFKKDVELVQGYLKKVQMNVDDGSVVITPLQNLDKTVKVTDTDDGKSQIAITGKLIGTKPRGNR
jgi:hypothetical protein